MLSREPTEFVIRFASRQTPMLSREPTEFVIRLGVRTGQGWGFALNAQETGRAGEERQVFGQGPSRS
jgi:hypothetical protein